MRSLVLPLVAACLLAGCGLSQPAFELTLVDGASRCDGDGCQDAQGKRVYGRRYRGRAWYALRRSHSDSSRGRSGSSQARGAALPYWHADIEMMLRRPGKVTVLFDMSLPLPGQIGRDAPPPHVRYEEISADGRRVFRADRVSGRVELTVDDSCPCQTGRIELVLRDAGPDQRLDTSDDRLRRITRARLRRDDRPFCHRPQVLPVKEGLLVVGVRACPRPSDGAVIGAGACAFDGSGWLTDESDWNVDDWYDSSWVPPYRDGWDDGWVDVGDGDGDSSNSAGGSSGASSGSSSDDGWDDDWGDDDWGDDDWGDGWTDDDWTDDWTDDDWTDDDWTDDWGDGGDDDDDDDDW